MKWLVVFGIVLLTVGVSAQEPNLKLGPQIAHVMPVNSATNLSQPYSVAELQTLFNGAVWQDFWRWSSYGQFGPWTIDVAPYQTLNDTASPVNYNSCPSGPNALMSFGLGRIKTLFGNNAYFYDRVYFALPGFGCNVVGGGGGLWTRLQGRFGLGDPIHETGHSLGQLDESSGQWCDVNGCVARAYDDPYTPFTGSGGWYVGLDFAYTSKQIFGWVGKTGTPSALVITKTGDYTIEPLDGMMNGRPYPTGPIALSVQTSSGATIVETRATNTIGVLFHQGTMILDLDRSSSNVDRVLDAGQSFTLDGVSYTTLSVGPTGAVLHVTFPGSIPAVPASNLRAS